MKKLWLCGQYRSGDFPNINWDFQGIFSSKKKAIAACRNENYFIASIELDKELPDESVAMPSEYYPFKSKE